MRGYVRIGIVSLLLALCGLSQASLAQSPSERWVLLQSERVDRAKDQQQIAVKDASRRLRAIRIAVKGGDLELSRVVVRYGNGQVHFEERAINLRNGERTKPIGEQPTGLIVEGVDLTYKAAASAPATTVELWGLELVAARPAPTARAAPPRPAATTTAATAAAAAPVDCSGSDQQIAARLPSSCQRARITAAGSPGPGIATARRSAEQRWSTQARAKHGDRFSSLANSVCRKLNCASAAPYRCTVSGFPCTAAVRDDQAASRPDDASHRRRAKGFSRETTGILPPPTAKAYRPGAEDRAADKPAARDGAPPPPPPSSGGEAAAPRPEAAPRATEAAAPEKKYTEFQVLYGTTRQQEKDRVKNGRTLATFSGEKGRDLTLGAAVVTIPLEREAGSIPRPDWYFVVGSIAFRNEDPNRDFTIAAVETMPRDRFLDLLSKQRAGAKTFKDQVFVFVHGYGVGFDDAIFRTAQIAHDIGFDGPAVTYSWPSRGGTWDYKHDIDTAKESRDGLRTLLELVAKDPEVKRVNIIAHSMGNDPVLEVLNQQGMIAAAGGQVPDLKLNEVVLAAPEVTRTAFEQFAGQVVKMAKGVTLYASASDKALSLSRRISGLVRAGDVPPGGPVVVDGVNTIDVTDADTAFFSLNHSTFADRANIVMDLGKLFESGLRPPQKRFGFFQPRGQEPNMYWKYVRN